MKLQPDHNKATTDHNDGEHDIKAEQSAKKMTDKINEQRCWWRQN